MQASLTSASGSVSRVDRWIEAVLGIAGDPEPFDRRPTLRAFERILLFHLSVRLWEGAFPESDISRAVELALQIGMSLCFAMLFVERLAPLAIGGAFCAMLVAAWGTFPMTSNHAFLELWILLLLVVIGGYHREEAHVWMAAMRWSVALLLFYTGLQKVLYGAYFSGQFLIVEMIMKPDFGAAIHWMLPAAEWERLRDLIPNDVGVGPYQSKSPFFLAASNIVYVFELGIPFLLLWKLTRVPAVVLVFLFTIAIQAGARELFFAALLANVTLLFWPRDAHRFAFPIFVVVYIGLALFRTLGIGGFV